jgi:uncharacterized protein (DUF433 family)
MSEGQPVDGRTAEGSVPTVVQTDDVLGGEPRLDGRRVGVHRLYRQYHEQERSATALAEAYELDPAEVHAALAYATANPEQMAAIAERTTAVKKASETVVTPE